MHLPCYYFIKNYILTFFIFFPSPITPEEDKNLNNISQILFCSPVNVMSVFIFLGLKSPLDVISFFLFNQTSLILADVASSKYTIIALVMLREHLRS